MEFMITPSGTSPPEKNGLSSAHASSKSEKGSSLTFEKVLRARKAEAEEAQEESATAAATSAASAAALQPVPPTVVQTTGGLASSESNSQTQTADTTALASLNNTSITGQMAAGNAGAVMAQPVTTAALAGVTEQVQTGQSTTDPIGPEDQPVITPSALPQDALAVGVTFTEGAGTDGMKQGAVTVETSQSVPVLGQEGKTDRNYCSAPAPAVDAGPELAETPSTPTKVAQPTELQSAKVERNLMETQPNSVKQVEETNKPQETGKVKETDPKPEVVAANTTLETARQATAVVTREPVQRTDTLAASLAQQIHEGMEASIRQGRSSLRIQLSPKELGAIDIRLVSGPTGVSMTVIAEQASTGRMLEAQINQLRQNLADAGVQLSNLNINQHNHANQGNNQQANPHNANRFHRPFDHNTGDENGVILPAAHQQHGIDYRV